MDNIKKVTQKVLKNVVPSESERKKVESIINFSKRSLDKEFKKRGVEAEVFVGGSIAKDTWLRGQHDIDFFVKFNLRYENEDIGKMLGAIIKTVFKEYKMVHGTRDYYKVFHENYELEFIPVFDIENPSEAKNSMDASIFHVDYVKKKIVADKNLASQIRLLKAFSKANGVYGAETHISGLSGYVVELLMIHYKTFENIVNAAENMKPPVFIDLENHYKNVEEVTRSLDEYKLKAPIIVIDPVLKIRNACAALEFKTFSNLVLALRLFARKPNVSFFQEKKLTLKTIEVRSKSRGTLLVTKIIQSNYPKEDIFLAKLRRRLERICVDLEQHGVDVYEHGYLIGKNEITIFFEIETLEISKKMKHFGPPVWIAKENFDAFINKWKNVYADNVNIVSDAARKDVDIKKIVLCVLEKELENV